MSPSFNASVQYGYHPGKHPGSPHKRRRIRRRAQKRRRIILGLLSGVVVLGLATIITMLLVYSGIHMRYCMELGDPVPAADVFAKNETVSVSYITDMSTIDASVTGSHWIHISANGKDRLVDLVVRDTVAPQAQPVEIEISVVQQLTPDKLVSGLTDADAVNLRWDRAPAFGTVGDYPVVIRMRDMSGNAATVASMVHIRAVEDTITWEAGTTPPTLADFTVDDSLDASFVTDIAALPLDTPGEYDVEVTVNGATYTSKLKVVDTVAPQAVVKMVALQPGGSAAPEDFIASATDSTTLSYAFESEPDFGLVGAQDVGIVITDLSGNSVRESATLLISNIAPITVEARGTAVTVDEFDVSGYSSASLVTQLIPNTLGDHLVELMLDGQSNPTIVTVVDTTPPRGEPVNGQGYLDHPITANRLVKRESDFTEITYTFAAEPDWTKPGTQSVDVVLTDAAGNAATITSTLTLVKDTEAPEIFGTKDRYCYIGKPVAYFDGVFAEDNCDETDAITLDVDKSQVNMYEAGTYTVTYTATDTSGNSVSRSCKFKFVEETVTEDQINELADEVLSEIITDDMSMGKKAYTIYEYVFDRIRYTNSSDKTNWQAEAYRGLTEGRGDCFTYFSTAKCLLQRAGIPTMDVERHGGNRPTRHYWLLVNVGTGWYHFDAINVAPGKVKCFMKTNAEVWAWDPNFWSFDTSLYDVATEKFVLQ